MPTAVETPPRRLRRPLLQALALCLVATHALTAATATMPIAGLPPGARLALCGDSITEQMLYTRYVEAYILACAGRGDVSVFQFGWGGENADQFSNRILRGDLDAFAPTAVTLAYGANDGGNQAWQDWMQTMWVGRMDKVLAALAGRHPTTIAATVIAAPTWFQVNHEGTNAASVATSNATLARFRDLDLALAQSHRAGFADLRQRMLECGTAALAGTGTDYRFGGSDGVHAGANGHLMIAHEMLKALGFTGGIATITVDLTGGATTTAGHLVTSATAGAVTLASTRYPFCYDYDHSPAADRLTTILPYLPFSEELNRFVLMVEHLETDHANVTWGSETHRFTRAELTSGVNLAATFSHTPFDLAFAQLMTLIAAQQVKERDMIKAAGDATAPRKGWTAADVAARNALDAEVHAAIVPVTHVITIVPVRGSAAPLVSSDAAVGTVGAPFRYQIAVVNGATAYTAAPLPAGLTLDPITGVISGTPMGAMAPQTIALSAGNPSGTGAGTLTLSIRSAVPLPAVTSTLSAAAALGAPFTYQIVATNQPAKYYATGLPGGLGIDASSGRISGTPTAMGSTQVQIAAENAGGTGSATLVITVSAGGRPAP